MNKEELTQAIVAEAHRIKATGEDYDPCEPDCVHCLCAIARCNVDERLGIDDRFLPPVACTPSDFAMLDAIFEFQAIAEKTHNIGSYSNV